MGGTALRDKFGCCAAMELVKINKVLDEHASIMVIDNTNISDGRALAASTGIA
jgi:hypothetical protein